MTRKATRIMIMYLNMCKISNSHTIKLMFLFLRALHQNLSNSIIHLIPDVVGQYIGGHTWVASPVVIGIMQTQACTMGWEMVPWGAI